MVALGEKTFGSVDILVNMPASSSSSRSRSFRRRNGKRSSINLSSAFYGIRAAVPA